jgi:hypothetical protein
MDVPLAVRNARSWREMMLRRSTTQPACFVLAALAFVALMAHSMTAQTVVSKGLRPVSASRPHLPLSFEPNVGQTHRDVKFLSRAPGYVLFLTAEGAVVSASHASPLRFKWVGANARAQVAGETALAGKSHYYRGRNARTWQTNVPHYSRVRYASLYRGVDLVYYGTEQGRVEFDLIVGAGADPARIDLGFDRSEQLRLDDAGNLIVSPRAAALRADVTFERPRIYQDIDGTRRSIDGRYVIRGGNRVGLQIDNYDRDHPLVIDPVLTLAYSTFVGGTGNDRAMAIAVDEAGNAVITGNTTSLDFPTANAAQSTAPGGDDHFVTKLSANGASVVYSTYLGGSEGEGANLGSVALDGSGNAYVAGNTFSADFPTTPGAYQTSLKNPNQGFGSFDGYIVKLGAGGTVVYSTLLGGTFFDDISAIDVDSAGNAYVSGTTQSSDFPTQAAIKTTQDDSFVAKLNASGSALVYSTYFGGNHHDIPEGIAVDPSGNAYVTGLTRSTDFPTVNALQGTIDPTECLPGLRCGDAFLTKINAAGSAFVYSTYLGGNERDRGNDVDVDAFGAAYIVGDTRSTNFPTASPLQAANAGAEDLVVVKFSPAGTSLVFSTYLGGSGREGTGFDNDHIVGAGIAVDGAGDVYVAGVTRSADFPSLDAFQAFMAGGPTDAQAFVTKLNASGSALTYSTAINPPQDMSAQADVGIDLLGDAYIAGGVGSGGSFGGFPTTTNAFQTTYGGGTYDAFVAKLTHFTTVTIDIKPNSSPNTINLGSGGVVPVAILSSASFDATTVDPLTVTLASAPVKLKGSGTPQVLVQDVNGDGRLDLVIHIQTEALQLSANDTQAVLEAETFGGTAIVGTDLVRIVP